MNTELLRQESPAEFDARLDREDLEALMVPCSVCNAEIGQMCKTEDGVVRIRHARRLWQSRKDNHVTS
jgi:hypothetical protein